MCTCAAAAGRGAVSGGGGGVAWCDGVCGGVWRCTWRCVVAVCCGGVWASCGASCAPASSCPANRPSSYEPSPRRRRAPPPPPTPTPTVAAPRCAPHTGRGANRTCVSLARARAPSTADCVSLACVAPSTADCVSLA
eukprot:2505709-Prymnesium_polylepis.1